jgi:small subunit ribosomal protein S17
MSDMEKTVTETLANPRSRRKTRVGRVVSDKMTKSIVVRTEAQKAHRYYGKITARSTRYMVHDEKNEAKTGDLVRIAETRPLSARKRWRLVEILERAK